MKKVFTCKTTKDFHYLTVYNQGHLIRAKSPRAQGLKSLFSIIEAYLSFDLSNQK